MTDAPPSLQDLRALADARRVTPTDADLVQVQAFLQGLLPALEELEAVLGDADAAAARSAAP